MGLVAFCLALGPLVSCAQEGGARGHFESQIRPLLVKHCHRCHSVAAGKREGGLLLDSREGWQAGGDSGETIVPGKVESSRLIEAIRYSDENLQMPPDRRLPEDAIAHFEKWVRDGAIDPRDEPITASTLDPSDPVAGREHWAFQPLSETLSHWDADKSNGPSTSTIDRYVGHYRRQANLRSVGRADRFTVARRLYLRLTGLPPTVEQLNSFVNDRRANAYERLVDELLASPRFGERWGRHWLDLARYADSNGLDENFLFREAWRYRNWVIDAVNADVPYDRFLLEQLAGDLLPYDSIAQRDRQRIAAGFLVVGPKVLLGVNPDQQRMDVADEQMDTLGRSILGQTLGCARCHDHKFDPVPTANYYALAGIFTSTEVMEQRHMLGAQRRMERLVGLGHSGAARDAAYEKYWRERPQIKQRLEKAKSAIDLIKSGDGDKLAELGKVKGALAAVAQDKSQPKETRIAAQQTLIAELQKRWATPLPIPPRAMSPTDKSEPRDEAIRIAGQFDRPGEKSPRGFLDVFGESATSIPANQSGRVQLAQWLVDPRHGAGALTARVKANRLWHHLVGRGLVRTMDNFGRTGESPTHPELLDYLAKRLIDSEWSVKAVVREIVLSETFRLAADHELAFHQADPDNRWLWRAHRLRLEPEALWDSMRLAAGQLDLTPRDSTVNYLGDQATAVGANTNRRRTHFPCRSVYLPVIRNDLPELFDVFDFADPHATTGRRPRTTAATQGLYLLNSPSVMMMSEHIAKRLLADTPNAQQLPVLWLRVTSRWPTASETRQVEQFIDEVSRQLLVSGESDPELTAWTMVVQSLLASSRFQFVE